MRLSKKKKNILILKRTLSAFEWYLQHTASPLPFLCTDAPGHTPVTNIVVEKDCLV